LITLSARASEVGGNRHADLALKQKVVVEIRRFSIEVSSVGNRKAVL
jgi:hypothetical protein